MEYLAEFDDFLKPHLEKYEHSRSGNTNYLSQIYDEILNIMADKLRIFVKKLNVPNIFQ